MVVAAEEGDTELGMVEDAQVVVVVCAAVAMAMAPGTATTTATRTAHTSTVLASTLISGFIRQIMAPGGSMSGDEEDDTEAMELVDGKTGTERVTAINGSGCRLKGHHSNICRSMCRTMSHNNM